MYHIYIYIYLYIIQTVSIICKLFVYQKKSFKSLFIKYNNVYMYIYLIHHIYQKNINHIYPINIMYIIQIMYTIYINKYM